MATTRRRTVTQKGGAAATAVAARQGEASSSTLSAAGARPGAQYFQDDKRPVILFDGVCNLCNGGVNFVLQWDSSAKLRMAALQSEAGKELLERSNRSRSDISSIVFVEDDKSYIKSEAVLRIAEYLQIPFPVLAQVFFPFPLLIRDTVYDQVAANRYNLFGKTSECRIGDPDPTFKDRFIE
jgi:predicted DCC family thiol-disulfide oxidoreductase YuxK